MKTLAFFILFLGFSVAKAQVISEAECVSSIQGRAAISLTATEVENLCEQYPYEVVSCALDEVQSHPLSGDLKKSLHHCRLEYTVITNY